MDDAHNLQRFVDDQNLRIEVVYSELRKGRNRGHWMWVNFPHIKELGHHFWFG
jgi:uncharacterized protein (DUF1810 family)